MCERAVKEGVSGKSIIILNQLKRIYWDQINKLLMKKAFENNDLYMYDEDYKIVKIDVSYL